MGDAEGTKTWSPGGQTPQRALAVASLIARRDVGDNIHHTEKVCSTDARLGPTVHEIHKYDGLIDRSVKLIATSKFSESIYQTIYNLCVRQTQVEMLQIEWKSSFYHSDGRRRSRPKASTVHGWLVKWRATFSGNERLRKEGIREMREAKAVRDWKKKKTTRQPKAGRSKSLFRLWPMSLGKKRRTKTSKGLPRVSEHSSASPPSRKSTRHPTSPTHSPRLTPANSRRSSHNHQGASDRTPRGSRQASYNSARNIVRAAEKKR